MLHNDFHIIDKFEGQWVKETISGFGKYTFGSNDLENRDYYIGEFNDNLLFGKGRMLWTDGKLYDGEWDKGSSI